VNIDERGQSSNAISVPSQILDILFYHARLAPPCPSLIVLSTCFDFVIIQMVSFQYSEWSTC